MYISNDCIVPLFLDCSFGSVHLDYHIECRKCLYLVQCYLLHFTFCYEIKSGRLHYIVKIDGHDNLPAARVLKTLFVTMRLIAFKHNTDYVSLC